MDESNDWIVSLTIINPTVDVEAALHGEYLGALDLGCEAIYFDSREELERPPHLKLLD